MTVDARPDTQGRLTLTAQKILNQRKRGGFTWQTTEKEIKVCNKVARTSAVVVAAANRPRDAIRRMTVRPAVASRVEINRAVASRVEINRAADSSKVETNRAADKKKADRTKKPDANAGAVQTKGSRAIFLDKEFHS